jgi:MFS family permease
VISVGSSLLSFVCVGVGFYGMTVFLDGLARTGDWSRATISGATALYFVVTAVVGSVVGRLVDRLGARVFIGVGALVMGVGLLLVGAVVREGELYAAYAVMSIGFAMCGGVPSSAVVTRWFVRHRARAMTFTHTGVSVGGILLVPLATWLIQERGLAEATRWLAALVVSVAIPVVVFVLRSDPRRYGLEPDDGLPPPASNPLLSPEAQGRHWRPREVLRTRAFWMLALAFASMLFCQQAMLIHQLAFLREQLGANTAAFAVSTAAFGSATARLVIGGIFADRVDKRRLGVAVAARGRALRPGLVRHRLRDVAAPHPALRRSRTAGARPALRPAGRLRRSAVDPGGHRGVRGRGALACTPAGSSALSVSTQY